MGRSSLATSLRGGHHWTAHAAVVVTVTLVLVAASVVRTGSSRGRRNTGRRAAYSTDASEDQLQYCKLDRTYCSVLPTLPTDNCAARMLAGPKKAHDGSYSATYPRPQSVPSHAGLANTTDDPLEWVHHGVTHGTQVLDSIAASLADHPPRQAHKGKTSHLVHVSLLQKGDCSAMSLNSVRNAAEHALGVAVESRLWACAVFRAAYGVRVVDADLAAAIGEELLWQSVEYRIMLREWAQHGLRNSGALCRRGWGSPSTKYLGAGVWGVAYRRCLAETGCEALPRVIVKLAGLPTDTWWLDEATGKKTPLSAEVMQSGSDQSPEAFMDEAVRLLVTHGVTPHLLLGYGSWVCDDFLAVPEGEVPVTGINIKDCGRSKSKSFAVPHREQSAVCYNILENVDDGEQSPNLPVMAKEEVVLAVEESVHEMHETLSPHPAAWDAALMALFFEVVYTMAALQKHFPGFRHNDLHWWNVRTTSPYHTDSSRPSGDVFAPRDPATGKATTFTEYTVDGTVFRIPNYGYSVRIGDWDGAHSLTVPRLRNRKVLQTRTRSCGREIPSQWMWSSPLAIEEGVTDTRDVAPVDEEDRTVAMLTMASCTEWARVGCTAERFASAGLTALEEQMVLRKCPASCRTHGGVVNLTVRAATFQRSTRRSLDDPLYRDGDGNGCESWWGKCDRARCSGFDAAAEAALFRRCPHACGLWEGKTNRSGLERAGNTEYLVQVRGVMGVPDGIYTTTAHPVTAASADGAQRVVLQLTVRGRAGTNLAALGGGGTVEIFRRSWHTSFTLTPRSGKNGELRKEYNLEISAEHRRELVGDFEEHDVLYIAGNRAGHTGDYRVQKIVTRKDGSMELRVVSALLRVHDPTTAGNGGILFRIGRRCSAELYKQSTSGITPVDNEKFDLHFFFNRVNYHMNTADGTSGHHWQGVFPNATSATIARLFADVDPDLLGWYAPLVHNYKISDNIDHYNWWCDRKGVWDTNNEHLAKLKTPLEMLGGEMFAEFRGDGTTPTPAGRSPIAKYSLSAKLPDEFCIGTGELRAV
eukprot:m.386124 g.386124  ORF g.386124 m.386124 type:complete len:1038 (+) comp28279_c0_seq1:119-3232(+)